MLIRFTVSNFLSFKDETEFNMLTGDVKRHSHHVYNREHIDVLRAAAIYGANGAGKSNLIKAISFLKKIVIGEAILTYEKFKLSKENSKKPSEFEIEFEINEISYAYGVIFEQSRILEEWLYKVSFEKEDEIIFERRTDGKGVNKLKFSEKYLQTDKDKYFVEFYEKELLTSSKSFISTTKNEHFEEIQLIKNWISDNIIFVLPSSRPSLIYGQLFLHPELILAYNNLMPFFDTGLHNIAFKKEDLETFELSSNGKEHVQYLEKTFKDDPKRISIETHDKTVNVYSYENNKIYRNEIVSFHKINGKSVEFSLEEESDGTIRLLDLLLILVEMRNTDKVVFIDEIDQSIHPTLLKTFIKELMQVKTSKGQIIFTTHESNLLDLDIFRQDEIWFAEKNKEGATQFYSLSDFKPRYDLDIRKGYLNGRFGAIPFFGDLEKLNWNNYAETE